ncbi:MAG: hypothetical protein MJ223_04255 [Mycoplasmoidaceae bacterium]|nr:hypothetical protein [Mycoplasmoidaceae bacterium]
MSNIELISMSSDQCAILRKYFVYYQKQVNARSSMDLKKSIRFKMWIADLRYKSALRKAKRRVKKNKTKDLLTGERFYKQEMIHLLFDKKLQCYVIAAPEVKSHIKYIKVNSGILANPGFKTNLESALKCKVSEDLIAKIKAESDKLEANPFNDSKIRLVAYISYLQTLRSGLKYRIDVTKENKLAFFELQQTRKQCESIGLGEIRSKEQYEFAHEAYYKAF